VIEFKIQARDGFSALQQNAHSEGLEGKRQGGPEGKQTPFTNQFVGGTFPRWRAPTRFCEQDKATGAFASVRL